MKRGFIHLLLVLVLFFVAFSVFESCNFGSNPIASNSFDFTTATYVGTAACQSCHQKEHQDYLGSDHIKAMQEPTDSSVLGDFETSFEADGVKSSFFKKDNKFYINTQGSNGLNQDFEVKYAFGYYPLQQYLIEFPDGKMQASRLSWDSKNKKWFNQYAGQKIHHRDWLHWTGNSQNWNTMCASCHATNLQKNYDLLTDTYQTTMSEKTVGCESCHGAGSAHIDFVKSEDFKAGEKIENAALTYGKNANNKLQINTCAPCHARKTDLNPKQVQSAELLDNLVPELISNEYYFADGQQNAEDYEYGSFAQSKMFKNNVSCSNCHNPHSGKLLKAGNALCLNCHAPEYNTQQHHFHVVNTTGAQCINCHMMDKTYMGNDARRDHSFRIPRPDQSVVYKTPNACKNCHTNKSNEWASKAVVNWYGPKRAYHFSDDLLPGSLLNDRSEAHLVKLLSDTSQPAIARATAAYYLKDIQSYQSASSLLGSLKDLEALVRYQSLRSLENFDPTIWVQTAGLCLNDPVKVVRIAAADLYHRLPKNQVPANFRISYEQANKENLQFLKYQADFAVGDIMIGDYHLQEGDHQNAITQYLKGLQKDSLMNYARLNLSTSYNSIGRNDLALKTLLDAKEIDPKNDRIYFNLGLLYYEMGNSVLAMQNFEAGVKIGSINPNLYYNCGLLLQQSNKMKEAEAIFLKGYRISPLNEKMNFALASYYMGKNQPNLARKYIVNLQKINPTNPAYLELFRTF